MVSKSAKKPFDLHVVFLFNVVRDYMPGWLKRDILYWVRFMDDESLDVQTQKPDIFLPGG